MTQTLAAAAIPEGLTAPAPNLILYDGVCGLCNRFVRWLLVRDRGGRFCFAPLQGATATRIRERYGIAADHDSVVYVRHFGLDDERVELRSSAVLSAVSDLGGPWLLAGALRIVPRPLRDVVYDLVAKSRYRWFGRYDSCPAPPPEARARFLP